jgi:hypothetical protein
MGKSKGSPGRPVIKIPAGTKFGDLTIVQAVHTPPGSPGGQRYRIRCVCGNRETVPRFYLMRKKPKTHCGCKAVKADAPYTKRSWYAMHLRCYYKKHVCYKDYGGRGIVVDWRWHRDNPDGWENFKKDMGERPQGKTLDRKDPNGNYHKDNCRWATPTEQNNNQRHHYAGRKAREAKTMTDDEVVEDTSGDVGEE